MEKLIQYCTKASLYDGPFDSVVGWAAAGMGYLFKTANGHLVVVDGGNCEDAEAFVSLLEMNASTALPEIDLWIITHPHGDHYGALLEICRRPELAGRIRVKQLVYHFPAAFRDARGKGLDLAFSHFAQILAVTNAEVHLPPDGRDADGGWNAFPLPLYPHRLLDSQQPQPVIFDFYRAECGRGERRLCLLATLTTAICRLCYGATPGS